MTDTSKTHPESIENARPSILPFDPADLVAVRVRPAQFARMAGVSKQAVSQWIKEGKVTIGPDGLLDPVVASRQVFERTDPGRLRARVFRDAMAPYGELQKRVRELEAERDTWQSIRHLYLHQDEIEDRAVATLSAIENGFDSLIEAREAGTLAEELDLLWAIHFRRLSEAEIEEIYGAE